MSNAETAAQLRSATEAFDFLFGNDIVNAKQAFQSNDSPFHLLGLGVCSFLEAALGMETGLMAEASRCLALSEAGAKKKTRLARESRGSHRFQPGLEWEVLQADAVVLLGLTNALSESYMGYIQCIYALNSAHSKFTKLYKTVFPAGLDDYNTPAQSPAPSRKPSTPSLRSVSTTVTVQPQPVKAGGSIFGRWGVGTSIGTPKATTPVPIDPAVEGPIEDLIIAGTAFGFGLFNLVFSLLPGKVKGVVGFFGFHHDRKLALQALAVAAAKKDVHSVFAGLVLMTYHGVVLLLSGYQADEPHIIKQYRAIVDSIESRYPTGALWILNRAKILRMTHNPEEAIRVLRDGLKPDRPHTFREGDTLLVFELAWTLLAQRQYQEAADMFVRITELNSWSHATYYFIAAGCHFSLGDISKTQELLDKIPSLLERKKVGGKDLPTEVFIKKKLAFYKQKQNKRGKAEEKYAEAIKISPAEEIAIFWNTHARIEKTTAEAHIKEWSSLTPAVTIENPDFKIQIQELTSTVVLDLDNSDELAIRSLLLGIVYRTAGSFGPSRAFLIDAHKRQAEMETSTWVGGVALFEMAVLDLKETEAVTTSTTVGDDTKLDSRATWTAAIKGASEKLDQALALATSGNADLSSRLDSRIAMLREEMGTKKEMMGII